MIMNVLWTRLTETGANWRYVYKVILSSIDYNATYILNESNLLLLSCVGLISSKHYSSSIIEKSFSLQALTVIEYLIANGSERAVDDILEHSFRISVQLLCLEQHL